MLFKLTNLGDEAVALRIMLFNDREGMPAVIKDFSDLAGKTTATYVYTPPAGKLLLNDTTFDVPEAVRAIIGPVPAGDPKVMRKVVVNVQLMRAQSAGSLTLETPVIVPMSGCRFEPRGLVSYRKPTMSWNCTPAM